MPSMIQVGSILIEDQPHVTQLLGPESEPYLENWRVVKTLDSAALDRKIRGSGWNFFFMAAEMKVTLFGSLGVKKIQNALRQILKKAKSQNFNGLEVTGLVNRHFLGVPYFTVSAHSRHIQQSCTMDTADARRISEHDAEWAKG